MFSSCICNSVPDILQFHVTVSFLLDCIFLHLMGAPALTHSINVSMFLRLTGTSTKYELNRVGRQGTLLCKEINIGYL